MKSAKVPPRCPDCKKRESVARWLQRGYFCLRCVVDSIDRTLRDAVIMDAARSGTDHWD